MSNYNNEMKEFIPTYINRIVDELNRTNEVQITDMTHSVEETEDMSISNYLNIGKDSYFTFKFRYTYDSEVLSFDILLPKEVAGVFVINGKIVIPYNELVTDFRLKVHKGVLKVDDRRNVFVKGNKYYLVVDGTYTYELNNPETYSQIPTEYLELNEDLKKIIKSRLIYSPDFIDSKLCNELFNYDKLQNKVSDLTDITIRSTATYIRNRLNKDFYTFMNSIRYRYRGGNRSTIGQIYTNEINRSIKTYFSINSGNFNYFNNVTNPLTLQSLSSQVKVPYGKSFNASVFDVIDVIDTPINNNINKINYLNRNVKLENGDIKIQVYDKNGNAVWLSKLDYISSNILESECWDYDKWEISEDYKSKELLVKYGKYQLNVDDLNEVDYIELEPNDRTSVTSSTMPLINKSELARMAMGTSMVKQGVNLLNAEDPIVTTEDLSELVKLNPLIITADEDGTVTSITRTNVTITSDKGSKSYKIPYALQSYTGNLVPFIPVVSIGSEVSKGDIIISPSNISPNSIKYGINAIAAFNAYFGYNSDDAIVISESFAEKLSSIYVHKQSISVRNVNSIKFIAKPGTKVNSNDILLSYTVNQKSRYSELMDESNEVTENIINKAVMNNISDAFLFEVNIVMGPSINLDEESYKIIESVNEDIDLGEYENKIPLLPKSNIKANLNEITLEFSFLMKRKAKEGDKLTNRYGNKGIIAKIVPDKDMIRTADGLVADICLSRESVPARKNISQIFELYLGQISKSIKDLWYKSDEDKVRAVGVYNTLFKTDYSVDEFSKRIDKLKDSAFNAYVGTYSNINVDEVITALTELGVSIKQDAYIGGRKLKGKVLFGPMYIIKLQFLPENSLAITTSKRLVGSKEPELNVGKYRGEGQKLGEMESTALSVNSPALLEYYKSLGGVDSNIKRLYFDMLTLGIDASSIAAQIVKDNQHIPQDKLAELKAKFEG